VAPLSFSVAIRDPASAHSFVHLCTIPTANVWTLITIPNIPGFPGAGNWSIFPGVYAASVSITLACGSTYIAPAADTWQNGNFIGAPGMSNFVAGPVNSSFTIGFVQHEPGPVCSTPIDKPFTQNLDECLRYFCKTYDYDVAIGTASTNGGSIVVQNSTTGFYGPARFPKLMAKVPTVICYNAATGAANSLRLNGVDYAVTATSGPGKAGFYGFVTGTMPAVVPGACAVHHYIADSGW
jgi:hypothetical protein